MTRIHLSKTFKKHAFFASASVAALIGAAPALGQTETTTVNEAGVTETESNQTIIVTATKRASTVQDVPFSINAQTEADIQRLNATTVEDLSRNVAGLSVQNLGPGQSQVSVRGVSAGQIVRDQPGVKEQVGVYLDESVISLSLFTPDIDLFDLDRVETLRGPQGTLFGSGSVGGTIRYITNAPRTDRVEGLVEANINDVHEGGMGGHLKGAVNVPLTEDAAIRAVAYHTKYGGFIDALREGGDIDKDVNDGTRTGFRVAMLFEPWANVRITPRVLFQKISVDGFNRQEVFNLFANEFTTTRPPVTFDEREQFLLLDEKFIDKTTLADLTAQIGFGGVELTSVTSYINRDILVSRDASALTGSVSVDLGFPAAAVLLPSNLRDTTDLETITQELRLASIGEGPFQWVIGGFYSDIERIYAQRLPTPGYDAFIDAAFGPGQAVLTRNGFGPDSPYNADLPYDIEQKAVFGEASYEFGRLTATAGLRYYDFQEVRDFISGGLFSNGDTRIGDETSSDGFSPRVILTYEAWDNTTFNVQASKGFRLGGVNDPLNLPLCTDQDEAVFGPLGGAFDDETLWNYEAGVKSQFSGITFNAAAFYTDISNLQVNVDAGSCSSRLVVNVPEAHTMGVEVEIAAQPLDGLDLSIASSWVEAEFDSTLPEPIATATGAREGNRLPTVPKFQIAASAFYSFPIDEAAGTEAYFGATFQHVGSRYTQPGDQENNPRTFVHGLPFGGAPATAATTLDLKLPSYELLNISAGVEFDNGLGVTAYVNNLLDENALLSFDRERGGRARLGFQVGQPRTYGLTLRKRFGGAPALAPPPPPPPPLPLEAPASQTCPDGTMVLASEPCPLPPPPPPPPPPPGERG